MKESVGSIKIFLFIYGLGLLSSGISAFIYPWGLAFDVLGACGMAFGFGFLHMAFTIGSKLNAERVGGATSFLRLGYMFTFANTFFLIAANDGYIQKPLFYLAVSTVLFFYLYKNISRLAKLRST